MGLIDMLFGSDESSREMCEHDTWTHLKTTTKTIGPWREDDEIVHGSFDIHTVMCANCGASRRVKDCETVERKVGDGSFEPAIEYDDGERFVWLDSPWKPCSGLDIDPEVIDG